MKRFSLPWHRSLQVNHRFCGPWPDFHGPRIPIMPWVTPPLHPQILSEFQRMGNIYDVEAGAHLLADTMVTVFVVVLEGLTGRVASTLEGQKSRAMALSAPRRFACGNLNFSTRRPAIGRYFALTKARLLYVRQGDVDDWLSSQSLDLIRSFFTQIELCVLSDRLGFAALTLLPAPMRLQALLLSWAFFFGSIKAVPGCGDIIEMPVPGRREHLEQVLSVSSATLDKLIAQLHEDAHFERDSNDFVRFQASVLQPVHEWMRYGDGDNAMYRRPRRVEDMLYQAQQADKSARV